MTAEARSVVVRLSLETAQAIAASREFGTEMSRSLNQAEASSKRASRGIDDIGRTSGRVALVATAGLLAIGAATARFDKQMSAVQAATHETAANMDQLRQAALDAGQATQFSATEAGQGVEELAKAGVSTADILGGGLTGSLDLAAAGALGVGEAAETAASALTQFKLQGSDVPHVADLLAAGAGKAQGSVHDLGEALNQAGLVASQTGLSIEETTAGLASFASAGLTGSDAGTSFKTMLLALTPQSTKAADAMDAIGFSAYDAQGNFIGLEGVAQRLKDGLAGMSEEQRNATLKQIFGNDAIRAAAVLYEQGGQGIADWTAKVDDQGYAAQTAAARMNNLSGDIEQFTGSLETALINAGEGSQNSLRGIVQGATGLVNAFNKAPAPIQATATNLLAITAATTGGIWAGTRIIKTISDTREALEGLGKGSSAASKGLKGVAAAGAGLAVLTVALGGLRVLQDSIVETLPGLEQLTSRLLALQGGKVANLGPEFDSLGDSIDRIANRGAAQKVSDIAAKIGTLGILSETTSMREATDEIGALDDALVNLAASGGPEAARQAFNDLTVSQGLNEDQVGDLVKLLPQYEDALQGSANAAGLADDATKDYAKSTYKAANGTEITAEALKKIRKAYQDARSDAADTAASFLDISNNADKAKVSLDKYIDGLVKQAIALEQFTANAIKAGKRGLDEGLIQQLEKLGPVGALRMRQLANATDEQIDRANRAWKRGQDAVEEYVDATVKVPKELGTHLTVESSQALQHVRDVSVALAGLNDKTIYLTTIVRTIHQETRLEGQGSGGSGGGHDDPPPLLATNDRGLQPPRSLVSSTYASASPSARQREQLFAGLVTVRDRSSSFAGPVADRSGTDAAVLDRLAAAMAQQQSGSLIGSLTVPAMPGASGADVTRVVDTVVNAVSLAQRSGRWARGGDDRCR